MAAKQILKKTTGGSESSDSGSDNQSTPAKEPKHIADPKARISSSWKSRASSNPISDTRLRQAALKENKIADLRKMINEGTESMDIEINGLKGIDYE